MHHTQCDGSRLHFVLCERIFNVKEIRLRNSRTSTITKSCILSKSHWTAPTRTISPAPMLRSDPNCPLDSTLISPSTTFQSSPIPKMPFPHPLLQPTSDPLAPLIKPCAPHQLHPHPLSRQKHLPTPKMAQFCTQVSG